MSGSDMGSSPGLGHMPAETPGLQPAGKAPHTPAMIALLAILCREETGSPKPEWSSDGFSLKTFPENLGDPGQHGQWQSPSPVSSIRGASCLLAALRGARQSPSPLGLCFSLAPVTVDLLGNRVFANVMISGDEIISDLGWALNPTVRP